jgi:hypothetical protein
LTAAADWIAAPIQPHRIFCWERVDYRRPPVGSIGPSAAKIFLGKRAEAPDCYLVSAVAETRYDEDWRLWRAWAGIIKRESGFAVSGEGSVRGAFKGLSASNGNL